MNKAPPKYPLSLDERRKRREDPPLEDQKREDTIEELERNFKLNSH